MGLLAAVRSSLRLLGEFPRPRHSESRIRWNTVFIHPVCRPARFYPVLRFGVGVRNARRDLDFCGGHFVVVFAKPSRTSLAQKISSTRLAKVLIEAKRPSG